MKNKKKMTLWERYLTKEIGIEFKACLYFYAILFFYCVYRICTGNWSAGIIHMGEMVLFCYVIGYLQVYILWNFDEAERLGKKEVFAMILCTGLYSGMSFLCNWFERNTWVTVGFAFYIWIVYVCVFLIYLSKRRIDDKKLNEDLKLFQTHLDEVHDKSE